MSASDQLRLDEPFEESDPAAAGRAAYLADLERLAASDPDLYIIRIQAVGVCRGRSRADAERRFVAERSIGGLFVERVL